LQRSSESSESSQKSERSEMPSVRLRAGATSAVFFAVAAVLASRPALGSELYGRPLRGLSAVPAAEVAGNPSKWAGRSVRVEGVLRRGTDGRFSIDGALAVRPEGFSLPASTDGRPAAAEGKVIADGDAGALVASGVELRK
jgi:hypothetical protein